METVSRHGTAEVTFAEEEDGIEVAVRGEIDLANTGEITGALSRLDDGRLDTVVFDLNGLTYVDSAGLAMFVDVVRRLRMARKIVACRARAGSAARRVVDLAGLTEFFDINDAASPSDRFTPQKGSQ
jgi:anti-sigma B factor antagonist